MGRRSRVLGPVSATGVFATQRQQDTIRGGRRSAHRNFLDVFARSSSSLGPAWRDEVLTFGANGSSAYYAGSPVSQFGSTTIDLGTSDMAVEWDLSNWPKGPVENFFRFVDIDNNWSVSGTSAPGSGGTMYLFRRVAGSLTIVATATGRTWGAGYRLRVEAIGDSITVKIDGTTVAALTTSSSTFNTATRAGFGGDAGIVTGDELDSARWTRFFAEPLRSTT